MFLKLTPDETHIRFMKGRALALSFSALMIVVSILLVATRGFNFGIDFEGGILIEIGAEDAVDLAPLRSGLGNLGLGEVAIQTFGSPDDVLIRVQHRAEEMSQEDAISMVQARIQEIVPGEVSYRRVEFVGPKVSGELVQGGIIAVVIALVATMIYIWFRFEWQFGLGAIIAIAHDVILTLGLFALTQLEFSLSVVAAILTIVGYSLNDTVVIYDRVRENLRMFRKMDLTELLDLSLNQTLARTVMTGISTLLALIALFVFGGEVIRGFTAAMIWGVVIGTFSSVYIAVPVLPWLKVRRDIGEDSDERP